MAQFVERITVGISPTNPVESLEEFPISLMKSIKSFLEESLEKFLEVSHKEFRLETLEKFLNNIIQDFRRMPGEFIEVIGR